jgi:hypothetical protein
MKTRNTLKKKREKTVDTNCSAHDLYDLLFCTGPEKQLNCG